MEDVKARLSLIKNIVAGHSPLGSEGLDGEVVCLQMRRILEQIAFGSLLAHRETYESVHSDLERIWSAKRLIERLGKIHPHFFPRPIAESPHRPMGVRNFEPLTDGFLTVDDFVFLYDTTSGGIHTWNPFKPDEKVLKFERSIAEWIQRIERLLALHVISFAGTPDVWLVQMDHPEDHLVHAFIAPAMVMDNPAPATGDWLEPITLLDTPEEKLTVRFDAAFNSRASEAIR